MGFFDAVGDFFSGAFNTGREILSDFAGQVASQAPAVLEQLAVDRLARTTVGGRRVFPAGLPAGGTPGINPRVGGLQLLDDVLVDSAVPTPTGSLSRSPGSQSSGVSVADVALGTAPLGTIAGRIATSAAGRAAGEILLEAGAEVGARVIDMVTNPDTGELEPSGAMTPASPPGPAPEFTGAPLAGFGLLAKNQEKVTKADQDELARLDAAYNLARRAGIKADGCQATSTQMRAALKLLRKFRSRARGRCLLQIEADLRVAIDVLAAQMKALGYKTSTSTRKKTKRKTTRRTTRRRTTRTHTHTHRHRHTHRRTKKKLTPAQRRFAAAARKYGGKIPKGRRLKP